MSRLQYRNLLQDFGVLHLGIGRQAPLRGELNATPVQGAQLSIRRRRSTVVAGHAPDTEPDTSAALMPIAAAKAANSWRPAAEIRILNSVSNMSPHCAHRAWPETHHLPDATKSL